MQKMTPQRSLSQIVRPAGDVATVAFLSVGNHGSHVLRCPVHRRDVYFMYELCQYPHTAIVLVDDTGNGYP